MERDEPERARDAEEKICTEAATGSVLKGRYLLTRLLAIGGTSDIFQAKDLLATALGQPASKVIVKVPRPAAVAAARLRAELAMREVLSARQLRHENIVGVYHWERDGPLFFTVMEYLEGETLAERLLRSPEQRLPQEEAGRVLTAVADALAAMHRRGLVHCDLKPGNILLGREGQVKLIDFSTARLISNLDEAHLGYSGVSPAYASPELLSERPALPADDVFALGCIAYEMHAGAHPYHHLPSSQAAAKGLKPARPAGLSAARWRALRRALALSREARQADIDSFIQGYSKRGQPWRRHVTVLLLGVVVMASAAAGLELLSAQRAELVGLRAQMAMASDVVAEIRRSPPVERLQALASVDELAEPWRSAVLGQVAADVAGALARHIEQELAVVERVARRDELKDDLRVFYDYYPFAEPLLRVGRQLDHQGIR